MWRIIMPKTKGQEIVFGIMMVTGECEANSRA